MALILIADDDPLVGDIVRYTLSERGHIVGIVDNGHDALRVVETKQPDLVILDCSMPGIGGVDVLRRLRVSGTSFAVPVLMLTARSSWDDEEIALRAGADDYLRKPFDPAELVALVDHMLHKAERSRPAAAGA
jgi:DNA-binding response OmpR family regulator